MRKTPVPAISPQCVAEAQRGVYPRFWHATFGVRKFKAVNGNVEFDRVCDAGH
jgi:hypothetical protein